MVTVLAERNEVQGTIDGGAAPTGFDQFLIRDNGGGFCDKNFQSFSRLDSLHKLERGGKGIGRLLWLKVFSHAEVESEFSAAGDDARRMKRTFKFTTDEEVSAETLEVSASAEDLSTTVRLCDLSEHYGSGMPKTAETVAAKVGEHVLGFMALKTCPQIFVVDRDNEERIDVNERHWHSCKLDSVEKTLLIRGMRFTLTHLRLTRAGSGGSRIFFYADGLPVEEHPLQRLLPVAANGLSSDGTSFDYLALVSGKALDEACNQERTKLDLPESTGGLFGTPLLRPELMTAVARAAREHLSDYLLQVEESNLKRARSRVKAEFPQFRAVIKHKEGEIRSFSPALSQVELDNSLFRLHEELRTDLRRRARKLKEEMDAEESPEKAVETLGDFVRDWNEDGQAQLANYVIHRRKVLDLLDRRLEYVAGGGDHTENLLHQLFYPMKTSSDDVTADESNLWLLDERLNFHRYLASDLEFRQMPDGYGDESAKRSDVAIFNSTFAYSDDRSPIRSYWLIEFKKPNRDDYRPGREHNPIDQVMDYAERILDGRQKLSGGRHLSVDHAAVGRAYVVCSMTPSLIRLARQREFTPLPGGDGWYRHITNMNLYVELVSYERVISDAQERNRVLFSKLGVEG